MSSLIVVFLLIVYCDIQLCLLSQDVVLQWLMTDNIQLNQIDAEDPEVRKRSVHGKMAFLIVFSLSLSFFFNEPRLFFSCCPFFLSPRSQITRCCQTLAVCLNSSECAYKKETKTHGTSLLSLICLCSICRLTPYPKSLGEKSVTLPWVQSLLFPFEAKNRSLVCSAYKQLNVKAEPLQLIAPQFETPLPQLQPAVSFFFFFWGFSVQRISLQCNWNLKITFLLKVSQVWSQK